MMAAAATPRLLLALRAPRFRGSVWCCGAPLGLRQAGRGIASGAGQPPPPSPPPPEIPEIPQIPPEIPPNLPEIPEIPERLADLGLGGLSPVGIIQNLLEVLHLELGLPWWGAIAAGTVGARILLLPLVLRGQREAARLSLHLPQLQKLSQRLAEARRGADPNQVAMAYSELASYQRRHDVNPLRGFLVPLVQTPLFVSFFLALQGMAAAPVPGLLQGGFAWFGNLAAPDPFYILPVLVTASTWMVLELGAEVGVSAPGAGPVRNLLRLLPLLFLPFILHFPSAVFTYWLTSNSFSLLQTGLLRSPALRARLGVAPAPPTATATPTATAPPTATATPTATAPPTRREKGKLGVVQQLRKEWKEAQATHAAEQRQWRIRNHLNLAAKGPLRQTFSRNPLSSPRASAAETPKRPWKETLG